MLEKLRELTEQGYRPMIYIEASLLKQCAFRKEVLRMEEFIAFHKLNIRFHNSSETIPRTGKMCVFRYGFIHDRIEAAIKRRGGKIVSGGFDLPE